MVPKKKARKDKHRFGKPKVFDTEDLMEDTESKKTDSKKSRSKEKGKKDKKKKKASKKQDRDDVAEIAFGPGEPSAGFD